MSVFLNFIGSNSTDAKLEFFLEKIPVLNLKKGEDLGFEVGYFDSDGEEDIYKRLLEINNLYPKITLKVTHDSYESAEQAYLKSVENDIYCFTKNNPIKLEVGWIEVRASGCIMHTLKLSKHFIRMTEDNKTPSNTL